MATVSAVAVRWVNIGLVSGGGASFPTERNGPDALRFHESPHFAPYSGAGRLCRPCGECVLHDFCRLKTGGRLVRATRVDSFTQAAVLSPNRDQHPPSPGSTGLPRRCIRHSFDGFTMRILTELTDGPGYTLDVLSDGELQLLREIITRQYQDRLQKLQPDLLPLAQTAGIANYHTLPIRFDHASCWPKETRLLDAGNVSSITQMGFFRRIRRELGDSASISHDELNWRIVRPGYPGDVGPVHADKWFWDAGYGCGVMPLGYDRFKIWIAIHTEPGANGLCIKPGSHRVTTWKHHFEDRGGIRKPVLDEDEAALNMEILPLRPGQMVQFHDELLHGGVVNRGSTCRVSLELTVLYDKAESWRQLAAVSAASRVKKANRHLAGVSRLIARRVAASHPPTTTEPVAVGEGQT